VHAPPQPTGQPEPPATLEALGAVPIALRVVVGVAWATRGELSRLAPGDGWTCGGGWLLEGIGAGRCALAAAGGEVGVLAEWAKNGDLVLRDETVDLAADLDVEEGMPDTSEALHDAALDAPIVVRVELGSVSMLAHEWARLGPGDVILAGRRIAEPAILRVAGREVARGELVNVDGEVGVRIQQIEQGE
jgi:flagellar motor switch/type III secretory pathway protein FliN